MTSRNQNKPPAPRSPANKNRVVEDAPLDKRRKTEGYECESIEFTKEEVDALLNESFKGKKGKQDWMTEYQKKLKACIKWYQKGLEDLVEEKNNLCKMLDSSERKCVEAEAAMKVKEEELNDSRDDAMKQKEAAVKEVDILRGELQQFRESRERQLLQVRAIKYELARYREDTLRTIDDLRMKSTALEETCSSQQEQISVLQHQLASQQEQISVLQHQLADANHKLKELKGNIRVFCRVRPLLSDDVRGAEPTVCYPTSVESAGRGIDLIQSGQKYPFTFDKVFADDASQEEVFMEISQLVQSALDGYKVCIFAYGQTGSGKTYTMMGRPEAPQQKGLIPRSLEHVFQTSQALAAQGWKYKMQASMLEIYNETIRDLLSVRSSSGDVSRAEVGGAGKQYTIRHDADGNTYVSDLTIVDVCSIKEVLNLLQQAAHSRSVGKTDMNEHSSRSHFVFTLRIYGVNESTEQEVQGVLNLIDLAGSQRLSRSGATGERLTETQAINNSLSSLSDVIFALVKKEDHVPFRNSKLTYLLQPCLGGDSKTLMFVNVSPDPSSVGESLCSLRFAARVNSCEIGIPRRQTI